MKNYNNICEKMLSETMKYIDISQIKTFETLSSKTSDAIFDSAITSKSPITLVYTPAGTGKSKLVKLRANAVHASGIDKNKIMILNMNIAKSKQMSTEMTDINVMTFSDFTYGIFKANHNSNIELSDTQSVLNELFIYSDSKARELLTYMTAKDPQEQAVMTTLFVNNNLAFTNDLINQIGKIDHSLASMICQNEIYKSKINPYDISEIIINGIQNMSLPILCSILEYVNKYHCNLFITGCPEEDIYEFNMAYSNSMNVISAYKNIGIIRLYNTPAMTNDIKWLANKMPNAKLHKSIIQAYMVNTDYNTTVSSILESALTNYDINSKLKQHESILCLAKTRYDTTLLKDIIIRKHPNASISDLTKIQNCKSYYGKVASEHFIALQTLYSHGITVNAFFGHIYNALKSYYDENKDQFGKTCMANANDIPNFIQRHISEFIDINHIFSVSDITKLLINIESSEQQKYL